LESSAANRPQLPNFRYRRPKPDRLLGEIGGNFLSALEFHNQTLALCLLSDSSDDIEHA
jgi:hypothetical protein